LGANDGARAFGATAAAADDDVAAAAGRAARFSYGVMENTRHRKISSLGDAFLLFIH
jgi:hypothetical protein